MNRGEGFKQLTFYQQKQKQKLTRKYFMPQDFIKLTRDSMTFHRLLFDK